jgi:hypothetical protein
MDRGKSLAAFSRDNSVAKASSNVPKTRLQLAPKAHPLTQRNRLRQGDWAKTGKVLALDLAALASGFNKINQQSMANGTEADKHRSALKVASCDH